MQRLSLSSIIGLAAASVAHSALAAAPVSATTFVVGWEPHYGYFLETLDRSRHVLPQFKSGAAKAALDAQFAPANLKLALGKIIYCECEGRWLGARGNANEFTVTRAKLFVEDRNVRK